MPWQPYTEAEKELNRRATAARHLIRQGADPLEMLAAVVWGDDAPVVTMDEVRAEARAQARPDALPPDPDDELMVGAAA